MLETLAAVLRSAAGLPKVTEDHGMNYVCRDCNVYGHRPVGSPRVCWCCGEPNITRR